MERNAWTLSRRFGIKFDHLEFRRHVAISLLQKYGQPPKAPKPSSLVFQAARIHGQRDQQPQRTVLFAKGKPINRDIDVRWLCTKNDFPYIINE